MYIDTYMYVYIYMCVCVCVCVLLKEYEKWSNKFCVFWSHTGVYTSFTFQLLLLDHYH